MARIPAAERRQELIDAAVEVIAENGVDGATTRRIAEHAGAPLATLHYCFASKELLFGAVFEHVAAQYRDVLTRSDVHSDVATTARGLMRGLLEWYVANPSMTAAIFELINWACRQDPDKADLVYDLALSTLRTILRNDAAVAGQEVDPDVLDELAYVVAVLSDGFGLNWMVSRGVDATRQIDLTVGAVDAWIAANLGDPGASTASSPAAAKRPETDGASDSGHDLGGLVSWVGVG